MKRTLPRLQEVIRLTVNANGEVTSTVTLVSLKCE